MKKLIYLLVAFAASTLHADVQIGGGYFGHVVTHPGAVADVEFIDNRSNELGVFVRTSLAAYYQQRYHAGLLLQAGVGMRRVFGFGLFLEESIAIGTLVSATNSEDVYRVLEDGSVEASTSNRLNPPELAASVSLGIGYRFGGDRQTLVWLRPSIFWQFPHKHTSTFSPVLSIGITRSIGDR